MSVPLSSGTPISGPASSEARPVSARPHAKYIRQALTAKQAGESDIDPPYLEELASLEQERDPELFWSGAVRAVERGEARETASRLPAILSAWLQNPELEPRWRQLLERKLEESQGRGSFGARAEFFVSQLNRQAFDPKAVAPMLAAGLLGKAVQVAALGRLTAAAPAWWSRGRFARSAALAAGFGSEVALLGSAHGEFGPTALSLAAMKGGLWAGSKASLPLPLTLTAATALGLKAEERLGWRAPSPLAETFAEAGASALHFGLGMSLASRILGPRFREIQARLHWAARPPADFPGPAARFASRLVSANGAPPLAGAPPAKPQPMQMSALRLPSAIPASDGKFHPFELELADKGFEGRRLVAVRDKSSLWAEVERKALVEQGDPITPTGVTRVNFRLEEGPTRGKAFLYYDSKAVTLFFIDLEESMITGGPAMRPGTGSVFLAWLAAQARREGKTFNVTRITSPQTVRILEKMKLATPSCRVEACARLNPESYDEEYRVLGEFSFGDKSGWSRYRGDADFFNVFGEK